MSPQVKMKINEYLESIGGINSVDKKYRIKLIKECILSLNYIEKNITWKKLDKIYPMINQR